MMRLETIKALTNRALLLTKNTEMKAVDAIAKVAPNASNADHLTLLLHLELLTLDEVFKDA